MAENIRNGNTPDKWWPGNGEFFLKWVEPETLPTLKESEKYAVFSFYNPILLSPIIDRRVFRALFI